jgi:PncC family amidohydrolase
MFAQVTVRKLDHTGREVIAYPAQAVARALCAVVLSARWDRPSMKLDYVCLEPGDRWVETFYADRWYNLFEIRAADGRLKGWYANVTRPARITDDEVCAEDLALDVWVDPSGRVTVLDEEEFAALPLDDRERAAAREALRVLVEGAGPLLMPLSAEVPAPEAVVGELLRARGLTLAVAESCTGGLISHRITNVPGSSDYYLGSVTSYANRVKEQVLNVPGEVLAAHGAVSPETARAMAQGVCRLLGADLGLAVTGIAGPGGGTDQKPVGLVYIALVAPDGEWVEEHRWRWGRGVGEGAAERLANKAASAEAALSLLRAYLIEICSG